MRFSQLKHRNRYKNRPVRPFCVAYGMGVDSTAMLVELSRLYRDGDTSARPDLITFADTGDEKDATYAYQPVMDEFLRSVGFPAITVVKYEPKKTKNGHYTTLFGNCMVNNTLPSLAFGYKKCSLKWKRAPQDAYRSAWQPAIDCWESGQKVILAIGYDSGPADMRRQSLKDDSQYVYLYPLREWDWDRERCKEEIAREGLPVPPKSSCVYCPSMTQDEIRWLVENEPHNAEKIVQMENNAYWHLQGNMTQEMLDERYYDAARKHEENVLALKNKIRKAKGTARKNTLRDDLEELEAGAPKRRTEGDGTKGLWRGGSKNKPGRITDFMVQEKLVKKNTLPVLSCQSDACSMCPGC